MTRAEAILEARRKLQAGDFQRAVVKTVPEDLDYDRITLECGHTKGWGTRLTSREEKVVDSFRERCEKCAEEWIVKNSDAS